MDAELRSMIMHFRVMELQSLLCFAGRSKTGRKSELQAKCLELIKIKSLPISMKIKDLYQHIQQVTKGSLYLGDMKSSSNASNYNNAPTASSILLPNNSGHVNGSSNMLPQGNQFSRGYSYQPQHTMNGQYGSVPISPDVAMKKMPFYDIREVLLRPTSLVSKGHNLKQESIHSFCLSPTLASEISESRQAVIGPDSSIKIGYAKQVQIRFCALDTSEEQDDLFPPNLNVKVNGRPVQLPHVIPSNRPGVEPKQPSRPLNITSNIKCSSVSVNYINVQWMSDPKSYAMQVTLVSKLNAEELLLRLKSKRIQPSDFTRGRIMEIIRTEQEDLCAPVTSLRVTVACPLGKSRMIYPCRASTCKHLQCFDANAFLLMNEKRPSFMCPVCNKHLQFDDLQIDGYFMDVIQKLSLKDSNDIELFPDGTWEPAFKAESEIEDIRPPSKRVKAEDSKMNSTIDLDDDICIVDDVTASSNEASAWSKLDGKKADPVVIDVIDSSDEEEEQAPTEQRPETEEQASYTPPPPEEKSEEKEEIEIRPRRIKPRISYIEVSSSSESSASDSSDRIVRPLESLP